MKTAENKMFIRWCVLGAVGGILITAGDPSLVGHAGVVRRLSGAAYRPRGRRHGGRRLSGRYAHRDPPHVRPDGIVYRHPLCDAAYRKDPLSQVDAGFPSGHMEHSAGGDPGYRPGHAGACRYMDVCYEPEQHEYGYRDLVRSGCDLWEEAQHKRLPGIEKVHRNSVRITVDFLVRAWGLEPQRIAAREPKSRMSTNSIMPANMGCAAISAIFHRYRRYCSTFSAGAQGMF